MRDAFQKSGTPFPLRCRYGYVLLTLFVCKLKRVFAKNLSYLRCFPGVIHFSWLECAPSCIQVVVNNRTSSVKTVLKLLLLLMDSENTVITS